MLGLNVVLASVSVIALFRHPSEPRTIVVAAPPPPTAPAQPAALPPLLPSTQAATLPEEAKAEKPSINAPRAYPATPTPTVEKVPLLGVPSTKRSLVVAAAPKRLAVTPAKSTPAASENSEDEAPGVHLAERW
jgi:hypothetical protein